MSNSRSNRQAPNSHPNLPPVTRLPDLPIEIREHVVRHFINSQRTELVWTDDGRPATQSLHPLRHIRRPIYPSMEWWHPQPRVMDGRDVRNHPDDDRRAGREQDVSLRREVLQNLAPLLSTNREMREHAVRAFWDATWLNIEISSGWNRTMYQNFPGVQFAMPAFVRGPEHRLRRLVGQLAEPVLQLRVVPALTPDATLGEHIRRLSIRFDHAFAPYSGRQEDLGPWDGVSLQENLQEVLLRSPNVRHLEMYFDSEPTFRSITDLGVLEAIARILDERMARPVPCPLRSVVFRGGECRETVLAWRARFPRIRVQGLIWSVNPYTMVHYEEQWIADALPLPTAPPRWVEEAEE